MEKKIITISREFGSGGRTIGRMVAEQLGIPFYDKELVDQIALESGFAPKFVEEHGEHSPGSSLFSSAFAPQGVPGVMNGLSTADFLWNIQCSVILQLADQGPCVMIGRCADYALADNPDHLSLFIYAPMDVRVERVAKRQKLTPEEARKLIIKTDKRRASYYEYYSSKKWGAVDSYDFCLDSSYLGIGRTVELIQAMVAHKEHPITSPTEFDPTRPED